MIDILKICNQNILVAPLNWGLGHATRCIPLIDHLLAKNNNVFIASDGDALLLLQDHYPELSCLSLPSYSITYKYNSIVLNIVRQAPTIINAVMKERKTVEKMVKAHGIDVVISDNRFGCLSKNTTNYFMTHQVNLLHKNRLVSWAGTSINQFFIDRFDHLIIPDFKEEPGLAGNLSHSHKYEDAQYIGPLTRMTQKQVKEDIDLLIILSGPEPQRTYWEDDLLSKYKDKSDMIWRMVRGKPEVTILSGHPNVIDFCNAEELNMLICRAKKIIVRSGYSSIMDLYQFNKSVVFVATPGQTEQEYLKELHSK